MLVYFDSQDEVPGHLSDKVSAAEDGRFLVELESAEELHDISGLKSALEREREARRKAEQEAKRQAKDQIKAKAEAVEETASDDGAEEKRISDLSERRLQKDRAEFETRIQALERSNDELRGELTAKQQKLSQVLIDASVTRAFDRLGIKVKPGALQDVLARAHQQWSLEPDSNGQEAPDFKAWAAGLYKSASHLFETNAGGGAPSRGGDIGPAGKKRISRHDKKAFSENLDGIARGEVSLTD